MKKPPLLLVTLLFFLFATNAVAQEFATATSTIQDVGFTGKLSYAIDINIISDGSTQFALGTTHLAITYNSNALTYQTLSLEHPDFNSNSHYEAMQLNQFIVDSTTGGIQLIITPADATGEILPNSIIRLARITFNLNSPAYKTGSAEIAWYGYINGDYTYVNDINEKAVLFSPESDNLAGNTSLICLPLINGIPNGTAPVGQPYSFQPTLDDVCSAGPFTFSIAGQPGWAGFNTDNGRLSGTPVFSDVNAYTGIGISVTDSYGDSTSLTSFDLDVVCPPAPTLSGSPTVSIVAGNTYSFTPTVSDGCGTKTFSITNKPAWATFSAITGALTGTPTLANVGTASGIVIRVTDQNSNYDELDSFNIQVTPGCVAPIISGTPDESITSGHDYSFTPTVSNGCGTKTFSIT
ncbi:MAG: putative Ig domain-containing protein, partial [Desulfobacteraceae bacterium]|nr:putative Ig domain-containing protein [Desulfobacteraceae bacterium]